METFVGARPFVDDPDYLAARIQTLADLNLADIDAPIRDLIHDLTGLPHAFTLQSCWGHFVHAGQPDLRGCAPLAHYNAGTTIRFQLAYIAVCLENSVNGRALRHDLNELVGIDTAYIQFGSAQWFWKQRINSYVLQVEPERFKDRDRAKIGIEEALVLERLKQQVFDALRLIVKAHLRR